MEARRITGAAYKASSDAVHGAGGRCVANERKQERAKERSEKDEEKEREREREWR